MFPVTGLAEDFQSSEEAKTSVKVLFFFQIYSHYFMLAYKYIAGMDEAMSIAISING